MAINKTKQSLEDSLVQRVKDLEDQLTYLKTHPQPIGADILDIRTSFLAYGPATLAAGQTTTVAITTTPLSDFVLTLFNFEFTVYVDVRDGAHAYSGGGSLSSGQRNLSLESWLDYNSSLESGDYHRIFIIRIKNNDSVSHDYYIDYLAIHPKFTVA